MSHAPGTTAVRVAVTVEDAELAADALWQAGAAAIEERPGSLVAATADGGDPRWLLAAVAGRWPAEAIVVDLEGALDAWRPHAQAVVVGDRLVVRPPWVDRPDVGRPDTGPPDPGWQDAGGPAGVRPDTGPPAEVRDIVIDPGRAFGHGAHPTTRLVLDALVEDVHGRERVLDVGCGSGVLAIAALVLGAGSAVGVDTDPAALAATRANAARNGVADRLAVVDDIGWLDDIAWPDTGTYDLVVANMLASQLVAVAPAVTGAVASGGTVVLSGLLTRQRDLVLGAYRTAELAVVGEGEDEGWLCLTLRAG